MKKNNNKKNNNNNNDKYIVDISFKEEDTLKKVFTFSSQNKNRESIYYLMFSSAINLKIIKMALKYMLVIKKTYPVKAENLIIKWCLLISYYYFKTHYYYDDVIIPELDHLLSYDFTIDELYNTRIESNELYGKIFNYDYEEKTKFNQNIFNLINELKNYKFKVSSQTGKKYIEAINEGDYSNAFSYGAILHLRKEYDKAIEYYKKAIDYNNNGDALYNLALIYHKGPEEYQDLDEALKLYKKAAKLNQPKALYVLGILYHTGEIVEKDINEAIKYYELAKKQNVISAKYNLALLYHLGDGVKQEYKKAIKIYKELQKVSEGARYNLAYMYYNGEGINKDIDEAKRIYPEIEYEQFRKLNYKFDFKIYTIDSKKITETQINYQKIKSLLTKDNYFFTQKNGLIYDFVDELQTYSHNLSYDRLISEVLVPSERRLINFKLRVEKKQFEKLMEMYQVDSLKYNLSNIVNVLSIHFGYTITNIIKDNNYTLSSNLKIIPKELFLISLSKQKNDLASSISKGIIFDSNQDVEFELALDNASEYKKYKLSKNGLVELK